MKAARTTALLILLVALGSCRTRPVELSGPITIPEGLSRSQIQLAIAARVANYPNPHALTGGQKIAEQGLRAAFGPFYGGASNPAEGEWFLESVESDAVLAGCQYKAHYLRVAIRFDDRAANIEIIEARNLKYTGKRIHKQGLIWLRNLEMQVRRALSQMAAFGTPTPSRALDQPPR